MRGSLNKRFFKRAVLSAAALVAGLTMVGWNLAPDALAKTPNHLHMYVKNLADQMVMVSGDTSEVIITSDQIGVGQTEVFKAIKYYDRSASTVNGNLSFTISAESGTPACSVNLYFHYTFNRSSGHCDDKRFTMSTVEGSCKVQQVGTCYDASSCECNFTFTRS